MRGLADHRLWDCAAAGASAGLAPHYIGKAWALPTIAAPQTFDHFMQEHFVAQPIEPRELAN